MTYPTKCTLAMVLWVAGILFLTGGCKPVERTISLPKSSFDRMIGGPTATDTNINASLAAIAIAFNRELLTQSNHWFHASAFIRTMDERLKALEAKVGPVPTAPTPGAVPPLHSAPAIPGLEKPQ